MSSIIQTLKLLKEADGKPITARELGKKHNPWISLNTVIKNICYLRMEYGKRIILPNEANDFDTINNHYDLFEKNGMKEKEKKYWFNKNHVFVFNNCDKISNETRTKLNKILKLTLKEEKIIIRNQNKILLIKSCEKIRDGIECGFAFPENHIERQKINIQIEKLKKGK